MLVLHAHQLSPRQSITCGAMEPAAEAGPSSTGEAPADAAVIKAAKRAGMWTGLAMGRRESVLRCDPPVAFPTKSIRSTNADAAVDAARRTVDVVVAIDDRST